MNAHFQNEHIGQTSNDADKKVCRLCSHVAADIVAVRQHLVKHHGIDLENPAASLVEPESTPTSSTTTTFNGDLIISRRSSPVTITDSSVDLITSSVSPDRTSPVLGPVKIELIEEQVDEQEHAKDLSIKGQHKHQHQHRQQQRQQQQLQLHQRHHSPEVIHIGRKRAASPNPVKIVNKKSPKLSQSNNNSNITNEVLEIDSNWQCQHCNITFPNQTLYFLHRGFHSDSNPWRCNGCGVKCSDMFDFNTHLVSDPHR
jgi:Pyruvate/2-oxoacid:ferredoxin oxidoreductase delta subunit